MSHLVSLPLDDAEKVHKKAPPGTSARRERFKATSFFDVAVPEGAVALVSDVIFAQTLIVIFGESGCGKSFFAFDLCANLAAGRAWAGKETFPGAIVYISAEGARGFMKRIVAFREHANPPRNMPFYLITEAPDFGHTDGDSVTLITRIKEQIDIPVALVVFDTLARAMQGADENSAVDMSVLVDNSARLMTELNCSVAWIHHAGKDASRGARGSSVLRAAADTEILVEKTDNGRTATVTKQKDAESGLVLAFELDQVELGDAQGETSCVVRLEGEWTTPERPKALQRQPTGKKKHLLQIIRNVLAEHGEASPGGSDCPPGQVVNRERVRTEAMASQFGGADCQQNSFRAQLSTALSGLTGDGWIGQRGDWIWVAK